MKLSFWQRGYVSSRGDKRTKRASRAQPRRSLFLEPLEHRLLLALTPQMVLDINTTTQSSNPAEMLAIGSLTYFTADDGVHGVELWKSDGTAAGTKLVKDIYPGSSSPTSLEDVNGTLFFSAYNATAGDELWKSDGTEAGTTLVRSLPWYTTDLTNVNGTVFFTLYDGSGGRELWKSNGTAAGTTLVKNIGLNSSDPAWLTPVNGTLFFTANDGTSGQELWKSDGTAAGTVRVKDINPGSLYGSGLSSNPTALTNVNGTLYFAADDGTNGQELWKSDGTAAGTTLVKNINLGGWSYPSGLTNVNGTLFFSAYDGGNGFDLWKSDGSAAGTVVVNEIVPNNVFMNAPWNLTNVDGTLFFTIDDWVHGDELWKSDGSEAGTTLVKDISAGSAEPRSLTNVNGTLFFTANDGSNAWKLWKSNGTEAGTVLVADVVPSELMDANGTLMFANDDLSHGRELWKSNGTAAGTAMVKDIHTVSGTNSDPGYGTDVNGTLFFTANDGLHGYELWKSDGTVAGTTLVKDILPGTSTGYYGELYPKSSSPANLTNVNGTLFFLASNGWTGELWKSDGTEAGTMLVSTLGWGIHNLTNVNGTLFFTAGDAYYGSDGAELWKSDGTAAGTTLVKDIYPGTHVEYQCGYFSCYPRDVPNSSSPGSLTNVNGTLFFTADDGASGRELWKSDGTAAGTVQVKDLRPGGEHASPNGLTHINGAVYFSANDGANGNELWKSDGTAAGTLLVKDIYAGTGSSYPSSMVYHNGALIFTAYHNTHGQELWRTDGTAAGTVLLKDIRPGTLSSDIDGPTVAGGKLYFSANNGTIGEELWQSDGTAAGTVLVEDLQPGSASSYPSNLTTVNGALFFTTHDQAGSSKLWRSDGTQSGTFPVTDFSVSRLASSGGTLFFSAHDEIYGTELWKLHDDGLPALTIDDVTVIEGHAGTQSARLNVRLSAASSQPVTVAYSTADGTAAVGTDYQAASGTLTFVPGETSKTITVLVNGDRLGELDETFYVNLNGATNAAIGNARGMGTILDDEPRIRVNDVTKNEGNSGTSTVALTISLSAASDLPVTVAYATANGTATAGSDYLSSSGTLTIPAGQTSRTINVSINGDRQAEPDESLFLNLSNATNGFIIDGQGLATILDDEPRVSIGDVSKTEGKKNQTTLFTFTVTLSAAYDQAVTMSFKTLDGTAKTSDADYIAKSGTLTFQPGETSKTITIEVKGDPKREADEAFYLDLYGLSSNSSFTKNRGTGTIFNDD